MHIDGLESVPNTPSSQRGTPSQPIEPQAPTEPNCSEEQEGSSADAAGKSDADPAARAKRLAQIKAAIEAGEYETPDKLDAALSRLFDEIGLDDE